FFSFEYDYTFAQLTLFKFTSSFNRPAVMGSVDGDGVLTLNLGPSASGRLQGNLDGNNENMVVTSDNSGNVTVQSLTVDGNSVDAFAHDGFASFSHVKKIVATMGGGNETLDLSGVTDSSIEEDITGGSGTDIFMAGNGNVTFTGGSGSDTLYGYNHAGGTGVEMLIGGSGNDTFFAQGGANVTMIG